MTQFGVAIPTYGAFAADPGAIREMIIAAEELGYESAWFADHIVMPGYAAQILGGAWYEPLAMVLFGLGATSRIRLGVDVLVAPYRNPVLVAKQCMTADRLSGGRMILGLGVGYIRGEFDAVGAPPYESRGAVTDEYLDLTRTLFETEGPISFEGTYVQLRDVHFAPRPTGGALPLWVGGNKARAWTRAALRGDGWHPLFPTSDVYRRAKERIDATRSAHGITRPFTYSYSCGGCRVANVGETIPRSIPYGGASVPDEFDYAPPPPHNEHGRPYFQGSPDQLVDDVREFRGAGVEHFTLRFFTQAMTSGGSAGVASFIDQLQRFQRDVVGAL